MRIKETIEAKLAAGLKLDYIEVINESNQHNVPPGSESHFKIIMVSGDFADKQLVARHQHVYRLLQEELAGPVHALALHTYTPAEWAQRHGAAPASPPCRGGGRSV